MGGRDGSREAGAPEGRRCCLTWEWLGRLLSACLLCPNHLRPTATTAATHALQVEAGSYRNIALSLGVDSPDEVLFATDNILEAQAAAEAGWQVVLADRPGNKPLPAGHAFAVARSAADFLAAFC